MNAVLTTLRPVVADDLPALATLERACFAQEAWDETSLRAEIAGPGRHLRVATDAAGAVVGYVDVLVAGDVADLLRIATDPAVRRSGVATGLLDDAVAHAAATGADRMLLEVSDANAGAVAFYAARGFTQIDLRPRYYRDGSAALVLQRALLGGPQ